jgi:ABC-type uncharacterized transport system substrate-binding protein
MDKNTIIVLLVGLTLASVRLAQAQQPRIVSTIGFFSAASASSMSARTEAFSLGLRDLGYVEGKNIVTDYRYADGKLDRLSELAAELVRLKVDAIVTAGPAATRPAMKATATIPIVMARMPILLGRDS